MFQEKYAELLKICGEQPLTVRDVPKMKKWCQKSTEAIKMMAEATLVEAEAEEMIEQERRELDSAPTDDTASVCKTFNKLKWCAENAAGTKAEEKHVSQPSERSIGQAVAMALLDYWG